MKSYHGTMKKYAYADFYVSPLGNDSWSGTLPAPNATQTDGPFASVKRARDAVRILKNGLYRNIYVLIRGGDYCLTQPVVFTGLDSHYDSYKIVYAAYPAETPVFHSDIPLIGWRVSQDTRLPLSALGKVYETEMPILPNGKSRFYALYEDGEQRQRACSPGFQPTKSIPVSDGGQDSNGVVFADRKTLHFPKGSLQNWENLEDIEIFIQPNVGYVTNYLPLASVDEENCVATTTVTATYDMGRIDRHQFAMEGGSFRVENALSYLMKPGQWVLDAAQKRVYYYPVKDTPQGVTVPGLIQYFFVDGHERGEIVKGLVFEGLTFTRSDRDVVTDEDIGLQHDWDVWNKGNAMLRLRDAEECVVDGCRFYNGASAGVRLDLHCQSNLLQNNLIDYVGGTGILLCGYGPGTVNVNRCNRILNNHIHHCGTHFYHSSGIMLWQSSENIVKNNLLHHLPYDSIVLSGVRPSFWNARGVIREMANSIRRFEIPPALQYLEITSREEIHSQWRKILPYYQTRNNIIEENEMFLTMQVMFDGNAIYLSDVGSGNLIRRNYIHHLNGMGMQQAIRTDAFIKDTVVTENIIYNCNGGGINTKYFENHVTNNIVADIHDIVHQNSKGETKRMFIGYISLLEVYEREKMPPNANLKIERNIFYKTSPHQPFFRETMVNGVLTEIHLEEADIDHNLYWDVNAPDNGASRLSYYRSRGIEPHGKLADPLFEDIHNGDFRLREDSPALALGFLPIDQSRMGLTNAYPKCYDEITRKQLGADYDDFSKLEKLCETTDSSLYHVTVLDNV